MSQGRSDCAWLMRVPLVRQANLVLLTRCKSLWGKV